MHDDRERVDRIPGHQDIELDHRGCPVPGEVIVDRSVAPRHRLEPVVEIEHDLVEGHLVGEHHAIRSGVLETLLHPALFLEEFQNAAEVVVLRDHRDGEDRFLDARDSGLGRPAGRVIDLLDRPVSLVDAVADSGRCRDQVQVELALQALLHDLQVQQAEEPATKAEPERDRALGLETERAVVELQLLQSVSQGLVLVGLNGIQPREHHRLGLFESRQGRCGEVVVVADRVADPGLGDVLDVGDDPSDLTDREGIARNGFRRAVSEIFDLVRASRGPEADPSALRQDSVHDPSQHDHTAIGVVPRVEQERA